MLNILKKDKKNISNINKLCILTNNSIIPINNINNNYDIYILNEYEDINELLNNLINIEELLISDYNNDIIIPKLEKIKTIEINNCKKNIIIPNEIDIEVLNITYCEKINLNNLILNKLKKLVLSNCPNIKFIQNCLFNNLIHLEIINCNSFVKFLNYSFNNLIYLNINSCNNISELPLLNNLKMLNIINSNNLKFLPHFINLQYLIITNNNSIKNLSFNINDILYVYIHNCKYLNDFNKKNFTILNYLNDLLNI